MASRKQKPKTIEKRVEALEKSFLMAARAILKNANRIEAVRRRLKREDERIIRGFQTEAIGDEVPTEAEE